MLLQNQRAPRVSCDLKALWETHRGILSVQEHREERLIYDADVVKSNAMKNQRTPRESCDLRAVWETHRGFLSVQAHREETLIYDVDVVKCSAMRKSKNTGQFW